MTNGEKIQKDFKGCEVCEPIVEDDIIHVIFADKKDSAIGFDWSWWNAEYKEPTIKNDLPHCQHTDEEIAKSFIEDVEAVKDQLPCGEQMDFPSTFDEFAKDYGFKDRHEIYTNGSELISVYRVKQWLEHIATTKNDLGVDCISRQEVLRLLASSIGKSNTYLQTEVLRMSSVTSQEPMVIPIAEVKFDEDKLKELVDKAIFTVTPQEPRKGHWVIKDNMWWVCSACGCKTRMMKKYNVPNFCPACGAKMEGGE